LKRTQTRLAFGSTSRVALRLSALTLTGLLGLSSAVCAADSLDRTPIEAITNKGEKVMLYPTGKWEYADAAKAAEAKKVAEQFPENKVRSVDAQGGWMPGTKALMPGDKDYNRGSLRK
jgi:hypothetical protein